MKHFAGHRAYNGVVRAARRHAVPNRQSRHFGELISLVCGGSSNEGRGGVEREGIAPKYFSALAKMSSAFTSPAIAMTALLGE